MSACKSLDRRIVAQMVYDRSETHRQLVRNYGSNAAQVCATDAWNGCKTMGSAEKTNGDNGSVSTTDANAVKTIKAITYTN